MIGYSHLLEKIKVKSRIQLHEIILLYAPIEKKKNRETERDLELKIEKSKSAETNVDFETGMLPNYELMF